VLELLREFASSPNHPLGLLLLLLSSAVEYLFPPFPGDTVTLFGAVLITSYRWSFWGIILTTTLGSLLGAAGDYALGALARRRFHPETPQGEVTARRIAKIAAGFEKHGELYIVVNRFLPGIRAFFFYAAGYSGMRLSRVLFYAALSAVAWNLLIIGVGATLGANLDELEGLAWRYTEAVWVLLGAVVLFFVGRSLWRRRRSASSGGAPEA
jgi:membrane protein DedA with SNARE-associated domain